MAKKKTTKRNPQDLTLRNLRALKKRVELLEGAVAFFDQRLTLFRQRLMGLYDDVQTLLAEKCEPNVPGRAVAGSGVKRGRSDG